MHGGWCWREVQRILSGNGHEVYTPTLTGQGDRRQGLTPQVGIAAHVADLTELIWFEDLRDVHLVLHSYAGVLAGPVAKQAAGRLTSVTFLAAFIARPGQCLLDVEPPDVARRYRDLAASAGEGWFVPASPQFLDQWGLTDGPRRAQVAVLRCQISSWEWARSRTCPADQIAMASWSKAVRSWWRAGRSVAIS